MNPMMIPMKSKKFKILMTMIKKTVTKRKMLRKRRKI